MAEEKPYVHQMPAEAEDQPWWQSDPLAVLRPQARELYKSYAGFSSDDELSAHVSRIQKRAYQVSPYPSIGALAWLNPYLVLHIGHERVLQRVREGASILDCGCMVAPDLRYLAWQGAPTDKMYGFDIEGEFFDLAFDLYKDRERWRGEFMTVDALEPFEESGLARLQGKLDIIWCAKFLHIWPREKQADLMVRLMSLLKPVAGSMLLGSQNGYPGGISEGIVPSAQARLRSTNTFLADVPDIEDMMRQVSERTGVEWELEAKLLDLRTIGLYNAEKAYKKTSGYNIQWVATRK